MILKSPSAASGTLPLPEGLASVRPTVALTVALGLIRTFFPNPGVEGQMSLNAITKLYATTRIRPKKSFADGIVSRLPVMENMSLWGKNILRG